MFQALFAEPNSSDYTRLSVLTQVSTTFEEEEEEEEEKKRNEEEEEERGRCKEIIMNE